MNDEKVLDCETIEEVFPQSEYTHLNMTLKEGAVITKEQMESFFIFSFGKLSEGVQFPYFGINGNVATLVGKLRESKIVDKNQLSIF